MVEEVEEEQEEEEERGESFQQSFLKFSLSQKKA